MRSIHVSRTLVALGAALALAGCATAGPAPRSDSSPTVRCMNEPGRGSSPDSTRPLFFIFCAQSP